MSRVIPMVGMIDAGRNTQGWFPYAYTYRDWVIRAFNEDLPYDQFILQQLAADKLPNNDPRNLAALGFISLSRGGLGVNQHEKIDDKIDVVSRGLMGLTVSCARCHNHKFDPIPTRDYSFYTIFSNSREPKELPLLDPKADLTVWESEVKAEEKKVEAEIAKLRENRYPKLKELYRTAPEVAKSLRGVYEAREVNKDDELEKFAREKDYNVYMLKRWRVYLQKAGEDGVWAIWRRLAAIPEKDFEAKASTVWVGMEMNGINPMVARPSKKFPRPCVTWRRRMGPCWLHMTKPNSLKMRTKRPCGRFCAAQTLPSIFRSAITTACAFRRTNKTKTASAARSKAWFTQAYRGAPPRAQAVEDVPDPKPGAVFLRGKPENKGEQVYPQFLLILAGENRRRFTQGSGRLELAQAIASKDNPLTRACWLIESGCIISAGVWRARRATSARAAKRRRTPNCLIIWRATLSKTAGRSSGCTGC